MIVTEWEQWRDWAAEYTMLPYVVRHALSEDRLLTWANAWKTAGEEAVVLESGKDGRYTFLGLSPQSVIRGKGRTAVVTEPGQPPLAVGGEPLQAIQAWMSPFRSPRVSGAPKLTGGCIGFLGYDVVRSLERLPELAADDLALPDYAMMRFERLWIIDHQEHCLYCAVHTAWLPGGGSPGGDSEEQAAGRQAAANEAAMGATPVEAAAAACAGGLSGAAPEARAAAADAATVGAGELRLAALRRSYRAAELAAAEMKRVWDGLAAVNADTRERTRRERRLAALAGDTPDIRVERIPGIEPAFRKADYLRAVERIQQYISQGDVFQVNLSIRQSRRMESSPEDVYEWLRLLNPSPYMGLLRFPDFQLVCGSPELLIQLEGSEVRTRPIAGTRPRGASPGEDRGLADEMLASDKERAEHIMLVDLERNDLGRISRYGTVRVDELMAVERYSHVMHIVSEVRGELAEGKNAYDVIAATFPGGTITGAPKIRTMEIIEELEPVRRGPYTGAVGWIDYNGNMELNIIIRTLVATGGSGHVQSGAGIVIDSVPEKEYVESINKAKALWKAIRYSEREEAEDGSVTVEKEGIR